MSSFAVQPMGSEDFQNDNNIPDSSDHEEFIASAWNEAVKQFKIQCRDHGKLLDSFTQLENITINQAKMDIERVMIDFEQIFKRKGRLESNLQPLIIAAIKSVKDITQGIHNMTRTSSTHGLDMVSSPASGLFVVFAMVLEVATGFQTDHERALEFFKDVVFYLQELSIIESIKPVPKIATVLRECVYEAFLCILNLASLAIGFGSKLQASKLFLQRVTKRLDRDFIVEKLQGVLSKFHKAVNVSVLASSHANGEDLDSIQRMLDEDRNTGRSNMTNLTEMLQQADIDRKNIKEDMEDEFKEAFDQRKRIGEHFGHRLDQATIHREDVKRQLSGMLHEASGKQAEMKDVLDNIRNNGFDLRQVISETHGINEAEFKNARVERTSILRRLSDIDHSSKEYDRVLQELRKLSQNRVALEHKRDDIQTQILESISSLKSNSSFTENNQSLQSNSMKTSDIRTEESISLLAIERYFSPILEIQKRMELRKQMIADRTVDGAGSWILETAEYRSWVGGNKPILRLVDSTGLCNSYLSNAILSDLAATHKKPNVSVAYFFFDKEDNKLNSFESAIMCIIVQISFQNRQYRRAISDYISKPTQDAWKTLFADTFCEQTGSQLYLILDSIDDLPERDIASLVEVASQMVTDNLNIHVVFTGKTTATPTHLQLDVIELLINPKSLSRDIAIAIDHSFKRNGTLNRLGRSTKGLLQDSFKEKADSMLYVEMLSTRLAKIGRESVILRNLNTTFPPSLHSLYDSILNDCEYGRSDSNCTAVRSLLSFIAHAKRNINLLEASQFVGVVGNNNALDIELELTRNLGQILDLQSNNMEDVESSWSKDRNDTKGERSIDHLILESGKSTLKFVHQHLRQYMKGFSIKDTDLRIPSSEANVMIFNLLVQVLQQKAVHDLEGNSNTDVAQDLHRYAARFWAHHFVEIDVLDLSNHELAKVLNSLRQLLSNENNVLRYIVEHQERWRRLDKKIKLTNQIKTLLAKSNVNQAALGVKSRRWLSDTKANIETIFQGVARHHVQSWLSNDGYDMISDDYQFAVGALFLSDLNLENGFDGSLEDILLVANRFDDITKDHRAYRQIAQTLYLHEEYKEAILYTNKSLSLLGPSDAVRFRLYSFLANIKNDQAMALNDEVDDGWDVYRFRHGDMVQVLPGDEVFQQALHNVSEALNSLPENWELDEDMVCPVAELYAAKGVMEQALCQRESAIESYTRSRLIGSDRTMLDPDYLDLSLWAHGVSDDPSKFFEVVGSWSKEERNQWLQGLMTRNELYFGYQDLSAISLVTDPKHIYWAKSVGDSAKASLLAWNEEYLASTMIGSAQYVVCYTHIISLHFEFGDLSRAIDRLVDLTKLEVDQAAEYKRYTRLTRVRGKILGRIFEEFRSTNNVKTKLSIFQRFQDVLEGSNAQWKTFEAMDSFDSGPINILEAQLARIVNGPIQYQNKLQDCFDGCMDTLTDQIGQNDMAGFHLLAKVLGCVPGLERDAQIALSCQFSISDPNVHHAPDEDDPPFPSLPEDSSKVFSSFFQPSNNTNLELNVTGLGDPQKSSLISFLYDLDHTQISPGTVNDQDFAALTPTSATETASTYQIVNDSPSTGLDNRFDSPDRIITKDNGQTEKTIEDEVEEEDLILSVDNSTILCNGCGQQCKYAPNSFHFLCILCIETDLCSSCHQIRVEMNQKLPYRDPKWEPFCEDNHVYVKAPIQGWKGIKNGVMRIGNESIPFNDWLTGLRDERWPNAWEKFWTQENSLPPFGAIAL